MTSIGQKYELFRPQFGRFQLCGLGWDIQDRLLEMIDEPTEGGFGFACEKLAQTIQDRRPLDAGRLFHFAQFQELGDIRRKRRLQAQSRELFWAAMKPPALTVHRVEITHGERALPAILIDSGAADQCSAPLVLLNGLDSAKEVELWSFAMRYVANGIARCVLLDGPGQGESLWARGIYLSNFESIVPSILNTLNSYGWKVDRIALFGVSFGGFLAMKLAQLAQNICAAVCFSCAAEWSHLQNLPSRLSLLIRSASGVSTETEWNQFRDNELRLPWVRPRCPVLIVHGVRDAVMPIDASRRLAKDFQSEISLIELDDGHVFLHYIEEAVRDSAHWLAATLYRD